MKSFFTLTFRTLFFSHTSITYLNEYLFMGAARFPGPPNLHDLQNWFKQLILQLPICIPIVQHVT